MSEPQLRLCFIRNQGGHLHGTHSWLTRDQRFMVFRPVDSVEMVQLPHWELSSGFTLSSWKADEALLRRHGLLEATFPTRARALDALSLALQLEEGE